MKIEHALVRVLLLSFFLSGAAQARELFLEICPTNHSLYSLNGRQVTPNQLDVVLGKIIDSNMFVYVFCETNVMLGQISKVLNSIQNAGLRYVLLACSGQQGGGGIGVRSPQATNEMTRERN